MSSDVHIAYQVVGDGPFDVVYVPGFVSNIEATWDSPARANFFHRLASFCRLILHWTDERVSIVQHAQYMAARPTTWIES
jgi:hypothetical protein